MKFFLPILLLCVLPTTSVSSQKKDQAYNLIGIDFQVIGTSCHYARRVGNGLYLGGEIGLLPEILDRVLLAGKYFTQENTIWSNDRSYEDINNFGQILFIHLFGRWKPDIKWVELDVGLRRAWNIYTFPYEDSIDSSVFNGAYIKPSIGIRRIKIGVRMDFGSMCIDNHDVREFVIIASPLIRINFL